MGQSFQESISLAWGLPIGALIVGAFFEPPAKPAIWGASLTHMGAACLINAARCGRVHCYFTGPFFLLAAVATLLHGFSIVPLGPDGWLGLIVATAVGGASCFGCRRPSGESSPAAMFGMLSRTRARADADCHGSVFVALDRGALRVNDQNLLRVGIAGSVIAALCCFTPLLVVLLGVVGLSALAGWLNVVLLPALVLFLTITAWALIRRHGRKESC